MQFFHSTVNITSAPRNDLDEVLNPFPIRQTDSRFSGNTMKIGRTFSGLLIVFAAACIGLALIYLPHLIISTYSKVAMFGSTWGILYLSLSQSKRTRDRGKPLSNRKPQGHGGGCLHRPTSRSANSGHRIQARATNPRDRCLWHDQLGQVLRTQSTKRPKNFHDRRPRRHDDHS